MRLAVCDTSRCGLAAGARRLFLLAHLIALLLLLDGSTSHLVLCTSSQDEEQPQRRLQDEWPPLNSQARLDGDRFKTLQALDKSDAIELGRQEALLRVTSELCAKFPHKCRPVDELGDGTPSDCASFGLEPITNRLVCVLRSALSEAYALAEGPREPEVEGARLLGGWGEPKGVAPYEMLKEELREEEAADYVGFAQAANQTGGQLDELGDWGEPTGRPSVSGDDGGGGGRWKKMATSFLARQPASLAPGQGAGSRRRAGAGTIAARSSRDPHRAKAAGRRGELARLQQQQQQQQQRRWQQLNMNQQIVSALPSAFVLDELAGPAAAGSSARPLKARARSMRQHRSGERRAAAGQPLLQVPKRTAGGGGGGEGATTSGHNQIIQEQQQQASSTTTTAASSAALSTSTSGAPEVAAEEAAMQCNMRQFTFTATKTDGLGNRCSGSVAANICYGGCDTGEIADWLFPGKKSIHKVCRHGARVRRRAILTNCTGPTEPGEQLRAYYYVDARDCVCKKCTSADTTCLGTMSQPHLQTLTGGGGGGGGGLSGEAMSSLLGEPLGGEDIDGGGGGD